MSYHTFALSEKRSAVERADDVSGILFAVELFIRAIKTKSRTEFERSCFLGGAMAISGPKTPLRFVTMGSFINWIIATQDNFDEQIQNPQVQVYEGSNLATVLAPFRAKINGKLDHVGVDLFILHRIQGRWKISGLADSSQHPKNDNDGLERFDPTIAPQLNISSDEMPSIGEESSFRERSSFGGNDFGEGSGFDGGINFGEPSNFGEGSSFEEFFNTDLMDKTATAAEKGPYKQD
jgi:hypothetical protein